MTGLETIFSLVGLSEIFNYLRINYRFEKIKLFQCMNFM